MVLKILRAICASGSFGRDGLYRAAEEDACALAVAAIDGKPRRDVVTLAIAR